MHECTSIIINSFHLFQKTLFNKGFQGFPKWGRSVEEGGAPHIQRYFSKPPHQNQCPPWGTPPHLKMKPPSQLKNKPPPTLIET